MTSTPTLPDIGALPEMTPRAEERRRDIWDAARRASLGRGIDEHELRTAVCNGVEQAYRDGQSSALAAIGPVIEAARDALNDAVAGLRYVRQHYHDERTASGDLYGVGFDRVEEKAKAALDTLSSFPAAPGEMWRPISEAPRELQERAAYMRGEAGAYRNRLRQYFDCESMTHYCWVVRLGPAAGDSVTHYLAQAIPEGPDPLPAPPSTTSSETRDE